MELVYTAILTFLINLPFGFLRKYTRKLTFCWFLTIHAPVPFIVWIRSAFGVELSFTIAPVLFGAYFLGQFAGKKMNSFELDSSGQKFRFFECTYQNLKN